MLALLLTLLAASPAPDAGSAVPSSIALPGGPPVSMDYLAYDEQNDRVWAPAGNTGKVDVVDAKTGKVTALDGFGTAKMKGRDGKEREIGPSAANAGDGFVYIGNRAGSQICAVDAKSLDKKGCVALASTPDGVAWVGTTREVWVTTPRDNSITIVDAKDPAALKVSGKIALEGGPEGYAVDAGRGIFYTNLEDKDRTLAIDVKGRKVAATWKPNCGEAGPRGLAIDTGRRHLFVACTAALRALDAGKDGAILGELQTGVGVDNIDYLPGKHLVYVAAGRAGTLTVVEADAKGALRQVASGPGAEGGRVVVVDSRGTAYIADSKGGRLVVVPAK